MIEEQSVKEPLVNLAQWLQWEPVTEDSPKSEAIAGMFVWQEDIQQLRNHSKWYGKLSALLDCSTNCFVIPVLSSLVVAEEAVVSVLFSGIHFLPEDSLLRRLSFQKC
jgi:hypothetical protein